MRDVFVARQPIFDRHDRLAGYELLYRDTAASVLAEGAAADAMCTDTVIHAFLDIGLDELTDGHCAFVNCTRDFLLGSARRQARRAAPIRGAGARADPGATPVALRQIARLGERAARWPARGRCVAITAGPA